MRNMMRALLIGLTLSAVGLFPALAAAQISVYDTIDMYVGDRISKAGTPGGAFALVDRQGVLLATGYGVSDLKAGEPVTASTLYAIGSMTKNMTATAILQLAEQGKVDLDAPVQQYLPYFQVKNKALADQITVRMLMTHTAGLPTRAHGVVWQDEARIRPSIEESVKALSSVELTAQPGDLFQYCNACYSTLGAIIETVSGQAYPDYMRTHLFEPLGMRSTSMDPAILNEAVRATEYAFPFGFRRAIKPVYESGGPFMAPAGGAAYSSLEDVAHYAIAHLQGGEALGLKPETLSDAYRGTVEVDGDQMYAHGGFFTRTVAGAHLVVGPGDTEGHSSMLVFLPEQGLGLVLLLGESNSDLANAIVDGVVEILMGQEPNGKAPASFWVMIGRSFLVLSVLGAAWLGWLVYSLFRRRYQREAGRPAWVTYGRVAAAGLFNFVGVLWWFAVMPAMGMPLPWGVMGYPVDIGLGSLLISAASFVWTIYSILGLFARHKARQLAS